MRLDEQDIRKFQELYKQQFGICLSKDDALDKGHALARLMMLVYKPMTQSDVDKINQREL